MTGRTLALHRSDVGDVRRGPVIDGWLLAAALVFLALLALALFGARLAPHESTYFVVEHGNDPRPYDPGIVFPFGSDVLGRDIYSLVLAGARATLTIILIGGIARVAAGVTLAALGAAWRPLGLVVESAAELVSAIPATLVALVVVKILVKADTTILVFVGALLVIGWAGPYRVVRAEIDRLAHAPFTIGARVLGLSGWRVFWRHQLPHLIPVLAVNLAQQTVSSLVLVAELGVLGTFVGTTRFIGIEESLHRVVFGPQNFAQVADPPEWGGLLAGARTLESLWTTRWLIFVPGVAFAITAIAIALIGFAVSRRYAARDLLDDLRGRGVQVLAVSIAVLVVGSALIPERYPEARAWAADARRATAAVSSDTARAFADANLAPLGNSFTIERATSAVMQTSAATVSVGGVTMTEPWPHETLDQYGGDMRTFVNADTGGGTVEAPLVFAARGIVPSEDPPPPFRTLIGLQNPEFGTLIADYPDDYAGVDVRGKVVMLVRFLGFQQTIYDPNGRIRSQRTVSGPGPEESIARAIKGGAVAVLLVDTDLPFYTDTFVATATRTIGKPSPYARAERDSPAISAAGVPVVVLSGKAAAALVAPSGVNMSSLFGYDDFYAKAGTRSLSRDLGVTARVSVPLEKKETRSLSIAGQIAGAPADAAHVIVWTSRDGASPSHAEDVLAGLAHALAPRRSPFIFVAFDPSGDARANKKLLMDALAGTDISLVLVLLDVDGDALEFATPNGDLIPALDQYADISGAPHAITRDTATVLALGESAPLPGVRTVLISGRGHEGDLRADAAALIGYLAGRLALGAEELPR